MRRAVAEYTVLGIHTTLPFFGRVLRHPDFVAGDYDTGFVARFLAEPPAEPPEGVWRGGGGGGRGARAAGTAGRPPADGAVRGARARPGARRPGATSAASGDLRCDRRRARRCGSRCARPAPKAGTPCVSTGREMEVDVRDAGPHAMSLIMDARSHEVGLERGEGGYRVAVRGDVLDVWLVEGGPRRRRPAARRRRPGARAGPDAGQARPCPGQRRRGGGGGTGARRHGSHEDGERDPRRRAPGRVKEAPVREGQAVETGALLVLLE